MDINKVDGTETMEFGIVHFFCGSGGAALGFQNSNSEYKGIKGKFRTVVGFDNDKLCCDDFERLTGAPAVCLDIFSREQYIDFHGHEPPTDWHEVTPEEIRNIILKLNNGKVPDGVFLSPPCKGFSGLLPEKVSKSKKYQALNGLVYRSIWLVMEAFKDDPVAFFMIENVPRITSRGAELLNKVKTQLSQYKYIFNESTHDCGEIGGLGQIRKRYLMIARNSDKIPSFIYQPPKLKLKSIGEILEPLPMPGDTEKAGKMHRIPNLHWKTWERLALIPAGQDWRALNNLNYSPRAGAFRIIPWEQASNTVTAATKGVGQSNGASAVADPRLEFVQGYGNKFRVVKDEEPCPTVTGSRLGSGAPIYADPKVPKFAANASKVCDWEKPSGTITGGVGVSNGGIVVSDPRLPEREKRYPGLYKVVQWDNSSPTVIGQTDIQAGALSVSDPRLNCKPRSGTMGVQEWDKPGKTVIASGDIHASSAAVADPRIPQPNDKGVFIIIAVDGTWHRPITTFEMAMLQGLPSCFPDGSPLELAGKSDAVWREHIGNMVPPPAATAIDNSLLETLMPNYTGEWFWGFSNYEIWVSPDEKGEEIQCKQ
mgnify:CR=1 FL=1